MRLGTSFLALTLALGGSAHALDAGQRPSTTNDPNANFNRVVTKKIDVPDGPDGLVLGRKALPDLLPAIAADGSMSLLPGAKIGRMKDGKYTATPDTIQIQGQGSTGDASGLSVTAPGGIPRTNAERAADVFGVKDKGARLDGVADDTGAFDQARRAIQTPGQRITVPAGRRFTRGALGGSNPAWWDIQGGLTFGGVVPSTRIDDDLTSSILDGRTRLWSRHNSVKNGAPVFRIDRDDDYTNPDQSGIGNAQSTNCRSTGRTDHVYCNTTIMHIKSKGSVDHYGLVSVAERMADSPEGASSAAALYTELKDSTNRPDSASFGDAGQAMAEMDFYTNGTDRRNWRTLIALRIGSSASDFKAETVAGATTISGFVGLQTAMLPGNVLRGPCLRADTAIVSYNHQARTAVLTKPATSTGTCTLDLDIVTGEVGNGVDLSPSLRGGKVGQGFGVNMPFYAAAFDASAGTSINNAPAFKLGAGQRIAFDGLGRGHDATYSRFLRYEMGAFGYVGPSGALFTAFDGGDFQVANVLRANALNLQNLAAPASSNDPSGTVGDIRLGGNDIYFKTPTGWRRVRGETF